MKKVYLFLTTIVVVMSFVSCTSSTKTGEESSTKTGEEFSIKTVEGYWWHSWGHEGFDYVCIRSNGTCDFCFGWAENKNCLVSIDNKKMTVTIHNKRDIEKILIYDKSKDMLVDSNYEMERISEEEFKEVSNMSYGETDIDEYTSATSNSTTTFRHESDVHDYLRNHNFVNSQGDITLTEGYDMALIANGTTLTGAIVVQEFNAHQAYVTANSPITGARLIMVVNNQEGTIYCQNDGTTYYVR